MWYYQKSYKQIGPIDSDEMEKLIRGGQVSRSTKVWREGMADWQIANQTELREIFPESLPPPIEPPPVAAASQVDDAKRLNTWFMGWWICCVCVVAIQLMLIAVATSPGSLPLFIKATVLIALVVAPVSALVFYLLIIRKLWSLIPANEAKTTPGKAIGFLFIPLFNFYWQFIAIYGLAKALNIEILKTPIENKKVTEALCLSVCITALAIFGALLLHWVGDWINDRWIRALGYVLMMDIFPLALFVFNIILLKQMKNAGIALIQKQ